MNDSLVDPYFTSKYVKKQVLPYNEVLLSRMGDRNTVGLLPEAYNFALFKYIYIIEELVPITSDLVFDPGWTIEVVYDDQSFSPLISDTAASTVSTVRSLQDVIEEVVQNEDDCTENEITEMDYTNSAESVNTFESTDEPDTIRIETVSSEVVFDNSTTRKRGKKSKNLVELEGYRTDAGYTCPNCNKIYSARKNLSRHMNVECGKFPRFSCAYCQYRSHRKNETKNHIKNKHMVCSFTQ
ncbi:hypothetical protein HHI36_020030 [Cryptolaemus montrouzieri]|uniref:C2H2-type domain-containing protein n=1 Tax=Cryptolaemus montrouzieri TaxID=559131 RepID=A0ABD2NAN3_9CUCU